MTLAEFIEKFHKESRDIDVMRTKVKVLSTYWSHVYNEIIDADVTNIGMDENSGTLYIEINKTGDEE